MRGGWIWRRRSRWAAAFDASVSYSDIALIASIAMLITAIVDWRRGVTGLGRLRLTRENSPDRFWMALVLYMNMGFLMFWLSAKAFEAVPMCDPDDGPCTITFEVKEE